MAEVGPCRRRAHRLLDALRMRRRRGEQEWALDVVRELSVPPAADLDDVVRLVARRVGRPIAVVPTGESFANGAIEEVPGSTLWIRVPTSSSDRHYQHVVCRGLARILYRERHDGHIDYSHAIEREMEYAAMALSSHLRPGDRFLE